MPAKKLISMDMAMPRFILNSIDFLFETPIKIPKTIPVRDESPLRRTKSPILSPKSIPITFFKYPIKIRVIAKFISQLARIDALRARLFLSGDMVFLLALTDKLASY